MLAITFTEYQYLWTIYFEVKTRFKAMLGGLPAKLLGMTLATVVINRPNTSSTVTFPPKKKCHQVATVGSRTCWRRASPESWGTLLDSAWMWKPTSCYKIPWPKTWRPKSSNLTLMVIGQWRWTTSPSWWQGLELWMEFSSQLRSMFYLSTRRECE